MRQEAGRIASQESGVSIVNIHAGQLDRRRVIEFYATQVLPKLPQPA